MPRPVSTKELLESAAHLAGFLPLAIDDLREMAETQRRSGRLEVAERAEFLIRMLEAVHELVSNHTPDTRTN